MKGQVASKVAKIAATTGRVVKKAGSVATQGIVKAARTAKSLNAKAISKVSKKAGMIAARKAKDIVANRITKKISKALKPTWEMSEAEFKAGRKAYQSSANLARNSEKAVKASRIAQRVTERAVAGTIRAMEIAAPVAIIKAIKSNRKDDSQY